MPQAPVRLRCEFTNNPLGVAVQKPRLSWWTDDDRDAEIQSAYEIVAASSERLLGGDQADVWHSGRVDSDRCAHVAYEGPELLSGQRIWWKVRTFDSDGLSSGWSEPAFFEMGLLNTEDWEATSWIATDLQGSFSHSSPVAVIRREFELPDETLSARLYVAALGDYRAEINGQRIAGCTFPAVWCEYDDEVYYQTYDITPHLSEGANAIGVLLSDGYFAGDLAGAGRNVYGARPRLRALIRADLADGQQVVFGSDQSWRWTASWILAAELNGGEDLDARQYRPGWSRPGFVEQRWLPVEPLNDRTPELRSQQYESIDVTRELRALDDPRESRAGERSNLVYDFGNVVVGRSAIELTCAGSDEVCVYYSLDETFDTYTVDRITTPEDRERWMFRPEFAVHSFRYLKVEYTRARTRVGGVVATRLGFSEKPALEFLSDHSTLNELIEVMHQSIEGVALSVPMRGVAVDERLPDAAYQTAWVPVLAQENRAHTLISKWLDDLALRLPLTEAASVYAPGLGEHGAELADDIASFESFVQILWALYRHQDDFHLLEQHYQQIRAGALAIRHSCPELLRSDPYSPLYGRGFSASLVATACLYGSLKTASRISGVVGQLADHELIDNLAQEVRLAFRNRFLTRDGHLAYSDQSTCVAALYHNLLEENERVLAERELIAHVESSNYHCEVVPGVLRAFLPTVTQAGRLDLAYMVLLQTSQPSWLGSVHAGDRLVARQAGRFDIADIGLIEWLVESMAGIQIDQDYSVERNGYRSIRVRPMPPFGQQFLAGSPVQFVDAKLATLHGVFEVSWRILDEAFEVEVVIPPSCQAVVTMPDGLEHTVRSGRHRFVMDFDAGGDGVPTLLERKAG